MATPSSDRFPSPPRSAQSEPRKMQCKRRKGERGRVVRVHVGGTLKQSLRACAKKEPERPGAWCPHARRRRAAAAATGTCGRGCRRASGHQDEPPRARHTPHAGRSGDGRGIRRPTRRQIGLRPSWGRCEGTTIVGKCLGYMWRRGKGSGKWYKQRSKT
jgi:hypothetical protein